MGFVSGATVYYMNFVLLQCPMPHFRLHYLLLSPLNCFFPPSCFLGWSASFINMSMDRHCQYVTTSRIGAKVTFGKKGL
jgi:hypothetical protein